MKRYTQQEGWVWRKIFSNRKFATIRLILAIVAYLDLKFYQIDVKMTFLNDKLDKEIYMN